MFPVELFVKIFGNDRHDVSHTIDNKRETKENRCTSSGF